MLRLLTFLLLALFAIRFLGVFGFLLIPVLVYHFYPRFSIIYTGLALLTYYLPESTWKDMATLAVILPLLPFLMANDD